MSRRGFDEMRMLEEIEHFWDQNPCGETLVGRNGEWEAFFKRYDAYRYATEGHILGELDRLNLAGKKVLEIGIGQAADSEQIIRRGAQWSGLDLTSEAVSRARKRFELFRLPFKALKQGSADRIPYPDRAFDLVYSHGVLHHIPRVREVSKEIRRVLRPGGKLVVMLYHRRSLNYHLSISVVRRVLMVVLYLFAKIGLRKRFKDPILLGHLDNAERFGLRSYLRNPLFMMKNTDGPGNPHSKVYDLREVAEDFKEFKIAESRIHFLNERHLPFLKLLSGKVRNRLAARYGWHLWVVME